MHEPADVTTLGRTISKYGFIIDGYVVYIDSENVRYLFWKEKFCVWYAHTETLGAQLSVWCVP